MRTTKFFEPVAMFRADCEQYVVELIGLGNNCFDGRLFNKGIEALSVLLRDKTSEFTRKTFKLKHGSRDDVEKWCVPT